MDDKSPRPDSILHARYREPGKGFRVGFRLDLLILIGVPSRLSGEESILQHTLDPSLLGTTSRNPHLMCISLLAFSISWVYIQVPPPSPCHRCVVDVKLSAVLTYIDLSATMIGISPEFSFYLLSIANA